MVLADQAAQGSLGEHEVVLNLRIVRPQVISFLQIRERLAGLTELEIGRSNVMKIQRAFAWVSTELFERVLVLTGVEETLGLLPVIPTGILSGFVSVCG